MFQRQEEKLNYFKRLGFKEEVNYYEILGIAQKDSIDIIKKAYRKIALMWHPDRHVLASEAMRKDAEEKFKKALEAYEVLEDSKKRKQYDEFLELLPSAKDQQADLQSDPFGTPHAPTHEFKSEPAYYNFNPEPTANPGPSLEAKLEIDLIEIKKAADQGRINELSDDGYLPLHKAIFTATEFSIWLKAVELCLELKAAPNLKIKSVLGHTTLLNQLAREILGNKLKNKIIKLLLEHTADPTLTDSQGNSAVHSAFLTPDLQTIQLFAQNRIYKTDELTNKKGENPLHIMSQGEISDILYSGQNAAANRMELLELITSRFKLNPEAKDNEENTPLQVAAEFANTDIMNYLIFVCGANRLVHNKDGKNVWEISAIDPKNGSIRWDYDLLSDTLQRHKELNIPTETAQLIYTQAQKTLTGATLPLIDFSERKEHKHESKEAPKPLPLYDLPLNFEAQGILIIPKLSELNIDYLPELPDSTTLLSNFNQMMNDKMFKQIINRCDILLKFFAILEKRNAIDQNYKSLQVLVHLMRASAQEGQGCPDMKSSSLYPAGFAFSYQAFISNPSTHKNAKSWEKFLKFKRAVEDLWLCKKPDAALQSLTQFLDLICISNPHDLQMLDAYKKNLRQIHKPYLENILDGRLVQSTVKKTEPMTPSFRQLALTAPVSILVASDDESKQAPAITEKINEEKKRQQPPYPINVRFWTKSKSIPMDSRNTKAHYRIR